MKLEPRSALLFCATLATLVAGCEPPTPPTTERIIRIQIEGCEDATPLPIVATPVAVETPTTVAVAATDTEIPAETPAVMQPRVERTPPPPLRTAAVLAAEFALEREGYLSTLAEAKLHPLDVPEATMNLRKADDLLRAKNPDEALRYLQVAKLDVQSIRMNEDFVGRKLKRVEARVDALRPTLGKPAERKADELLDKADSSFMNNSFRATNATLYELEQALDRRADALKKLPGR